MTTEPDPIQSSMINPSSKQEKLSSSSVEFIGMEKVPFQIGFYPASSSGYVLYFKFQKVITA
jgi:hypothetical protein